MFSLSVYCLLLLGKRLYVDEIIGKVPNLEGVSASEIKTAVESDPRKQFLIEESKGQLTIRLQENRPPRVRNLTVFTVYQTEGNLEYSALTL